MSLRRILVLHSYADEGMEERIRQADSNPALADISFHHLAIIDEDSTLFKELEARLRVHNDYPTMRDGIAQIVRLKVAPLLLAEVRKFKPEVLILHGGTIFRSATAQIIGMLTDIRRAYPDLPFALEGKSEWLRWIGETRAREYYGIYFGRVARQVGWVTSNFIEDPEVDRIIDELF